MSGKAVVVDVVSDVICPWCFLGKRRLDRAIALVPEVDVAIRWRPYFLDPTIPAEGMDRRTYMVRKFGEERLKTIHDPFNVAGLAEGVQYNFEKITRTPNTTDAHRVIRFAVGSGVQEQVVDNLFAAYWSEGRDIGDAETLVDVASKSGLSGKDVQKHLASDNGKLEVAQEVAQAQSMGVQGVPTFIFAQHFGISGAQSPETLADGIRRAAGNQG